MTKFFTRAKKGLAIFLTALIIVFRNPLIVVGEEPTAPTAPSAPSAPTESTAPETPTAPDAPDAPEEPILETDESDALDGEEENVSESNNDVEDTTSTDTASTLSESMDTSGVNGGDNNIGNTEIKTGDAINEAGIETIANTNTSGISADPDNSSGGITIANSGNGTDSQNSGSATLSDESLTLQTNSTGVVNNLALETETGDNSASRNVGDSEITTGDANTTGTLLTAVNTNIDGVVINEFNVVDDQVGDIVLDFGSNCIYGCTSGFVDLTNSGNGSESENNTDLDSNVNSYTFQNNDALVENNLILESDSGNNEASQNTGGDSVITTGDANVSANSLTFANNNLAGNVIYSVVNIFGELIGDIIFPADFCCFDIISLTNSDNGTESVNSTDVDLSNTDTTYQFNDADIQNNLILYANTGDNDTSANTGGNSSITTGEAGIEAQVLNVANMNLADGNWWLVIVNEAGNWVGKILGAPLGSLFTGSEGFDFSQDSSGEITVTNTGNGSGSENDSDLNLSTNNTVVQTNDAFIVNNLDLSANTGANSASRNTGGNSSITTGDADIIANLVNFVNNNIVGTGKLFVTVVNVFGSWMGDLVTPGQHKEENKNNLANENSGIGGTQTMTSSSNQSSGSSNETSNTNQSPNSSKKVAGTLGLNKIANVLSRSFSYGSDNNSNNSDQGSGILSQNSETQSKKVVNVNLAYFLFLIPTYFLIRLARRKMFVKVPANN